MKHGQYVYGRAVTQDTFNPEAAAATFKRVMELSEDPDYQLAAGFELYPPNKIMSVSNSDMAYNLRGPYINVLLFGVWAHNTPEHAAKTRQNVNELSNLIAGFEKDPDVSRVYGNYSMLYVPCLAPSTDGGPQSEKGRLPIMPHASYTETITLASSSLRRFTTRT